MVTVQLDIENKEIVRCKGCRDCIFCEVNELTEYGEQTGRIDVFCRLTDKTILDNECCYMYEHIDDKFILDNCPIKNIE